MGNQQIMERVKVYFNIMPDKEDEQEIIKQISSGVSFRGSNLWVLIFAIFTASLGLNVNSTAVIIGAMLISPLMGPIIGMGLAVGINDLDLLKRAARNFGVATLISVLTAAFYFLITPLNEASSELLARTSPTIYDVLIATCGGAAGIIALCTKGKGNVIPGVAIATALMPPLCTAGYGLATGHLLYFLGAFYLFFINTVFISLATYAGVRMMHFHRREFLSEERARKARRIVWTVAVVTVIPAAVLTVGIVRKSIFENNVSRFLRQELVQNGTQVISSQVDAGNKVLQVVAVGKEITQTRQLEAEKRMDNYGLGKLKLNIIQGEQSDSLLRLGDKLQQLNSSRDDERKKIAQLTAETAAQAERLESYTRYETLSTELVPELAALFPQVEHVALAPMTEASKDTSATTRYIGVVVGLQAKTRLNDTDSQRMHDWLQTRVKADSLVMFIQRR
ncbi:MAG: DUF389 domain-containing protein [Prevotella sp.]